MAPLRSKRGIALIPEILAGKTVEKNIMIPFVLVDSTNVDQLPEVSQTNP